MEELYQETLRYGSHLYFDEVPEQLSRLNETHPRLFLTTERIEELRSLIEGSHRDLWLKEKALVDVQWLGQGSVGVGDLDNQRKTGDILPRYALCYFMTHNEQYLRNAKEWVLAAISYPGWGPEPDLGKAHLLFGVSIAYDWLYHNFTSQEREAIRNRLAYEARLMFLASTETEEYGESWNRFYLQNHLFIDVAGLGAAGFALYGEIPDAEIWINQAEDRFAKVMVALGSDGASHEGVGYWGYGMESLLKYLDLSGQLLGTNYFNNTWLRETTYYRLYMSLPKYAWKFQTNVLDFGDSSRLRGRTEILRKLAAEYRNGYAQWLAQELEAEGADTPEASGRDNWLNLLWYDPTVPAKSPNDLPTMKHFDDLDYIVMRSDWSGNETLFAMRCGPVYGHEAREKFDHRVGGGHMHPDINHFVIVSSKDRMVVDDGYIDMKLTSTHNTLLINGRGQLGGGETWYNPQDKDRICADGRMSAIIRAESNSVYDYVIGDAYNIYPDDLGLTKFLRHVIFLKPDVFIIVDELETAVPSTFDWLMHVEGSLQKTNKATFTATKPDVTLNVKVIRPTSFRDETYNDPTTRKPTLKLSPAQQVNQTVFVVVLNLARTGEASATVTEIEEDGKTGLLIRHRGEEKKFLFNFARSKLNDRMFSLVGEPEPANTYEFTRDLPPLSSD
ncbi:MAG: DUF4962 domain-containing protein [Candidatus Bathyarchaeota archaeon]|nr:DUF4962 domain-containing protein [Candidatus Bathyarchaeota archaeon]